MYGPHLYGREEESKFEYYHYHSSTKQYEPITILQLVVIPEVKTIQQLADNQLISVRKAATLKIRTSTLVSCITRITF